MEICKQCGKEIPRGRKFCGSACAAKYNNRHRIRKPWTEKQKRNCRIEVRCKYCGHVIGENLKGNRVTKVCVDCKQYYRFIPTFVAAGIHGGSLKSRYQRLVQEIDKLYFNDKLSLDMVAARLRVHRDTIRHFLKLQQFQQDLLGKPSKKPYKLPDGPYPR